MSIPYHELADKLIQGMLREAPDHTVQYREEDQRMFWAHFNALVEARRQALDHKGLFAEQTKAKEELADVKNVPLGTNTRGYRDAVQHTDDDSWKPKSADPTGKDQHETGAKLDAGKNRLDLVLGDFPRALEAIGQIGTAGAKKYTEHGWLDVPDGEERYADAGLRHLLEVWKKNEFDPESGSLHLAHYAWNVLAQLELHLRGKDNGH